MTMLARPVDPRLCQKLQCGLVTPQEVVNEFGQGVVEECLKAGYTGTLSPVSPECRQYYPYRCQVGPGRWYPDSECGLAEGPDIASVLAAEPALPNQAVGLPDPMDYSSAPDPSTLAPEFGAGGGGGGAPASSLANPSSFLATPPSSLASQDQEEADSMPVDYSSGPSADLGYSAIALRPGIGPGWRPVFMRSVNPTGPALPFAAAGPHEVGARPIGPHTFQQALPSITPRRDGYVAETPIDWKCGMDSWIARHKFAALAIVVGTFFVLRKGGK